jgi:hypothetical protein
MIQARYSFPVPDRLFTRAGYLDTDGGGNGAEPLRNAGGGNGAEPLRNAGGGNGAEPFKLGGGNGAEPLAIITPLLLCDARTVFRLIAPTKTSMARSSALSLRDIESLQGEVTPETLYT